MKKIKQDFVKTKKIADGWMLDCWYSLDALCGVIIHNHEVIRLADLLRCLTTKELDFLSTRIEYEKGRRMAHRK